MGVNKKTIIISWFIGLGSGLLISGIILSLLIYTSNPTEPVPIENQEQEELSVEPVEPISVVEEEIVIEKEELEEVLEEKESIEENEAAKEMIELEIGRTATAKDIARMLADNGVIPDYDEFMAYVVSKGATRSLYRGKNIFPLNSDVETVFKILKP